MIISAIIICILITVFIIGKVSLRVQFDKTVHHLFTIARPIANKRFNYAQLNNLPVPVQRYFRHVLKDGQPYISYDGQFKTGLDKDWTEIKGE